MHKILYHLFICQDSTRYKQRSFMAPKYLQRDIRSGRAGSSGAARTCRTNRYKKNPAKIELSFESWTIQNYGV